MKINKRIEIKSANILFEITSHIDHHQKHFVHVFVCVCRRYWRCIFPKDFTISKRQGISGERDKQSSLQTLQFSQILNDTGYTLLLYVYGEFICNINGNKFPSR